ncbi:hypothetical protein [Lysobacter enzymogenes]|uniref:hypothetical protein n=1 Tax=Lysobacter enzymogenes TaxID=69 RepID=UPI001A9688D9|nr:hypothetical protein [Lysobacter enzymogenes]QQP95793.1 hypothetical protein JHW38_21645 [Lysobacter enzymogenes]
MKTKLVKTSLFALGLALTQAATPAFAAYSCWGKLDELGMGNGDKPGVFIRLNTTGLVWVVCSMNEDANCRALYSLLLSAQSSPNRPNIGLFFADDGKTCATKGDWVFAKPYYTVVTDDY